jgi:hypothetical protein
MKTINSISGGKTSAFLSLFYPTDYNIFSLVLIQDDKCKPNDDGLVKKVSDKIGKEFIATAESDLTLKVIFDLEQKIGREIIWVSGETFEKVNNKKKALPNQQWRYCTTEMKMRPIWDWWYKNIGEKIKMQIGFRHDEKERADKISTSFKGIIGKSLNGKRNKWDEIEWRELYFPLIENKINHFQVKQWADKSGLIFPNDSNCVGCFHKSIQQLRKNFEDEPKKMNWFSEQEKKTRWKKEIKYKTIKKIGLQSDFNFGEGVGCNGGFCTD